MSGQSPSNLIWRGARREIDGCLVGFMSEKGFKVEKSRGKLVFGIFDIYINGILIYPDRRSVDIGTL